MLWLDRLVAGVLGPLAVWVLLSGLDDLFLDLCYLYFRLADRRRSKRHGPDVAGSPADRLPQKKIAVMIPAWREDGVIQNMLEHNVAAIQYSNHEVFVGVYPNDIRTLSRVIACERTHPRVHHVLCPYDGPTSKGDCLNWVYHGLLLHEEAAGSRFDIVAHHDAEDLIHPKSLGWMNSYSERYDMVQVPVLPLPTSWRELTHGVYCDEFAESHLKELHLRQRLGGFLPSCGVGTAYRRRALDRLVWNNGNRVFEPGNLTEDYHIGLYLHRLGCSQILLPARRPGAPGVLEATREYFPRRFRGAVRQRARWIAGIALQSWQQIGWNAGPGQLYWLWRDRKGLIGNPLTILANLTFLYGAARWTGAGWTGEPWRLATLIGESWFLPAILLVNTALIVVRQSARAACVWPVYGWRHALLTPLRSLWGNLINFAATMRALALFAGAVFQRQPLRWLKTEHCYPTQQMLMAHKRRLGEVLAELQLVAAERIEEAVRSLQPGERLGEGLVRQGTLSEGDVYTALGVQQNLPFEPLRAERLAVDALGSLPVPFARQRQLIPIRLTEAGHLWVASCELPTDQVSDEITRLTRLKPRFQLITPSNYRELREQLDRGER